MWKVEYKFKWEEKNELKESQAKGQDGNGSGDEKEARGGKDNNKEERTETSSATPDWKYLYKQRLRSEKEKEFQKVSVEALKFQAKVALQLNRKREFDHAIQHLQTKKSRFTPPEVPQPTPTVTGWHPTHIQRHFNHMSATNPPLSPSQKEEIKRKAIHAATHGKFLQTCLEDVQKRNAFATQVLEKYTELSQEIEQRKKQLGNQLKRLRR